MIALVIARLLEAENYLLTTERKIDMKVKLYFNAFSNNAIRAAIALEEKEVDYEVVHVDIFNGEARSEWYRKNVNSQ